MRSLSITSCGGNLNFARGPQYPGQLLGDFKRLPINMALTPQCFAAQSFVSQSGVQITSQNPAIILLRCAKQQRATATRSSSSSNMEKPQQQQTKS